MADELTYFCILGLACGLGLGFVAACVYHIINAFFHWGQW